MNEPHRSHLGKPQDPLEAPDSGIPNYLNCGRPGGLHGPQPLLPRIEDVEFITCSEHLSNGTCTSPNEQSECDIADKTTLEFPLARFPYRRMVGP